MKALEYYGLEWILWVAGVIILILAFLSVIGTSNALILVYTVPTLCVVAALPLSIIIVVAKIAQKLESNIKAENIGLHQFNSGDVASPKDLFITGVDKCLEAGVETRELVTILRERYEAVRK